MRIFLKTLWIITLFIGSLKAKSQDVNYSQFYETPMLRNPALTGIFIGDIRATSAYRSQWNSVTTPYKTMVLGVDFKLPFNQDRWIQNSIGVQITHDIAGDSRLSKTQVMPVLNFHIPLDKSTNSFLSIASMGSLTFHHFDRSKLTFDDQFVNGSYSTGNITSQQFKSTNISYIDASAGILYSHGGLEADETRYYFGLSVFNFIPPNKNRYFWEQTNTENNLKLGLNAGVTIPSGAKDRFTLYGDYFHQAKNSLLQLGALFNFDLEQTDLEKDIKKGLTFGLMYRWADAVIPVVKIEYNKLYIGFSYDINVSQLAAASKSSGGFELTLSYKSFLNIRDESIPCPVF